MGQSLGMSCGFSLQLIHEHSQGSAARAYYRAALKAFKRFTHNSKVFYTCNVERLKECNRLGEEKEISLWRTHFFLCSPHFDEASGVVFSSRPGQELALLSQKNVESLFLATSSNQMVDIRYGHRIELTEPLVFASAETKQ